MRYLRGLFLVVVLTVSTAGLLQRPVHVIADDDCTALTNALNQTQGICNSQSNAVCYGNDVVNAVVNDGTPFSRPGSVASLPSVQSLSTSTNLGVAVTQMQDATSGKNLTLVTYGDTATNFNGSTGSIDFSSADGPVCNNTPSGLAVQTPQGQIGQVVLNNVTITLGSTALVTAKIAAPPTIGTVVYSSNQSGRYQLYTLDLATNSGPTPRAPSNSDDFSPSVSRDGRIAFNSHRDGQDNIYILNTDGSVFRLTNDTAHDYAPAWSPDGSQISFHSDRSGSFQIYVINSTGTGLHAITHDTAPTVTVDSSWSPDGSKIAYSSNRSGTYSVYFTDANGSYQQLLTPTGFDSVDPEWAPDGQHVAFVHFEKPRHQVYVIDLNGNVQPVVKDAYEDDQPTWSPDSKFILYRSQNAGQSRALFVVDVGGKSTPRKATSQGADNQFASWISGGAGQANAGIATMNVTNLNHLVSVSIPSGATQVIPLNFTVQITFTNNTPIAISAPFAASAALLKSSVTNSLVNLAWKKTLTGTVLLPLKSTGSPK